MKIFGVPVVISPWTLILGLIMLFDGSYYIAKQMGIEKPNLLKPVYWKPAIIAAGLILFSIFVHEFSHGVAIVGFGGKVVEAGASWWGAYVSPEETFAELAPLVGMVIAFAGPLSNFLLAAIFAIPVWLYPESVGENTVQYVTFINLRLGMLNLLPLGILDGGRIFKGLIRLTVGEVASNSWLVLVAGVILSIVALRLWGRLRLEKSLETL